MTLLRWPSKDPNEVLDYRLSWEARLETDDAITSSTWSRPVGNVVIDSGDYSDSETRVWLSGGTVGKNILTNRVTTEGGRTMEMSIILYVAER